MKFPMLIVSSLLAAASAGDALADISGGPVFGGAPRPGQVRCMVFNAGPGTATLTSTTITTGGTPVSLSFNSCKATLAAGKACVFAASPVKQVVHSCSVGSTGGALRGTIAVYSLTDTLLHSSDMR